MKDENKSSIKLLHTTSGRRYVFADKLTWNSSALVNENVLEVYTIKNKL